MSGEKYTHAHWPVCTCSLLICMCKKKIFIFVSVSFSPATSSVSKIGIWVMSGADGDNKLVEEPITSRWQAGGSGLSTCHYLHIDISKSPDRPFLRLPRRATMINPGKWEQGMGKKTKKNKATVRAARFHAQNVEACKCAQAKKKPISSTS